MGTDLIPVLGGKNGKSGKKSGIFLIKGRGFARVPGDPCGLPIGFFKVQISAKKSLRG